MSFVAFAASAHAADQPAAQWAGFYGGVAVTSVQSDTRITNIGTSNAWLAPGMNVDFEPDGTRAGLQLGYQRTWGNVLAGLEVSVLPGSDDQRLQSPHVAWHDLTMSVETLALLGARVGYAQGSWLIYGKAGYAGGDVKFEGDDLTFGNTYLQSIWQHGWHAGAGVEYAISNNLTLGLDYTHIDLGSDSKTNNWYGPTGLVGGVETFRTKADVDMVSLRLNWLFKR